MLIKNNKQKLCSFVALMVMPQLRLAWLASVSINFAAQLALKKVIDLLICSDFDILMHIYFGLYNLCLCYLERQSKSVCRKIA